MESWVKQETGHSNGKFHLRQTTIRGSVGSCTELEDGTHLPYIIRTLSTRAILVLEVCSCRDSYSVLASLICMDKWQAIIIIIRVFSYYVDALLLLRAFAASRAAASRTGLK